MTIFAKSIHQLATTHTEQKYQTFNTTCRCYSEQIVKKLKPGSFDVQKMFRVPEESNDLNTRAQTHTLIEKECEQCGRRTTRENLVIPVINSDKKHQVSAIAGSSSSLLSGSSSSLSDEANETIPPLMLKKITPEISELAKATNSLEHHVGHSTNKKKSNEDNSKDLRKSNCTQKLCKKDGETANSKANLDDTISTPISCFNAMNRKFVGAVVVTLPEGKILKSTPSNNDDLCEKSTENLLMSCLKPGESLLELLHGKGAQNLLLNAFCGHFIRRMYARLKCGKSGEIQACEFICEFSADSRNTAMRLANIQIFRIEIAATTAFLNSNNVGEYKSILVSTTTRHVFTTRHNSSCTVIYLDSTSIPILGHFPSEITGKSLFALIHAEDVDVIKRAHYKLRQKCGGEIIVTPKLRFLTYQGSVVLVNSEWTAFINPWTQQVEMIVGRHVLNDAYIHEGNTPINENAQLSGEEICRNDAIIHDILLKPVNVRCNTIAKLINNASDAAAQTIDRKSTPEFVHRSASNSPTQFLMIPTNSTKPSSQHQSPIANNHLHNIDRQVVTSSSEKKNNKAFKDDEKCMALPSPIFKKENAFEINETGKLTNSSPAIKEETDVSEICLSYNQINCLENVHRLLKSQAKNLDNNEEIHPKVDVEKKKILDVSTQQHFTTPLTRELLEAHDRKWENKCKFNWKKRLAHKRIATSPPCSQIDTKIQRSATNSRSNSSSMNADNANYRAMNDICTNSSSLPSLSSNHNSDISQKKNLLHQQDTELRYSSSRVVAQNGNTAWNDLLALLQTQLQTVIANEKQKKQDSGQQQQKFQMNSQTIALMNNLFLQYKQRLQQQ